MLTRTMGDLLAAPDRRRALAEANLRRSRAFSWDNVASAMLGALEDSFARRSAALAHRDHAARRRMALFTPLPPQRTGIAAYSASMLPYWSRHFELELVVDGYVPELGDVVGSYPVISVDEFRRRERQFDETLYHFGNSPFHARMYRMLPLHPGIVVMHDFYLSGLVQWIDAAGGDEGAFRRELLAAHGTPAAMDLEAVERGTLQASDIAMAYPVSRRVIQHARGLIFHSQFAQGLLACSYPDLAGVPSCVVPQACTVQLDLDARERARAMLGLGGEQLLVCAFGFLVETKDNHVLLQALSSDLLANDARIRLVFVGELEPSLLKWRIDALIASHPMRDRIEITGYVGDEVYLRYLAACDVGVSLRTNSRGETSAALLKQLAVGCATIVSDYAAMHELPHDIVLKVPPSDANALASALKELVDDGRLRARLGEAARRWVAASCHPVHVAQQYATAVLALEALANARSAGRLIARIARIAEEEGMGGRIPEAASAAIAEGVALHPSTARRLPWLN
jgi:glycosyltransferase involved in cell wall biosynthesis